DEEEECRRCLPDLCRVIELQPLSRRADRLTAFNGFLKCPVQNRSWNLLLQLCCYITDGFEQAVQVKSIRRRSKNHGRIIEKKQLLLNPLCKLGESGEGLISIVAAAFLLVVRVFDIFIVHFGYRW